MLSSEGRRQPNDSEQKSLELSSGPPAANPVVPNSTPAQSERKLEMISLTGRRIFNNKIMFSELLRACHLYIYIFFFGGGGGREGGGGGWRREFHGFYDPAIRFYFSLVRYAKNDADCRLSFYLLYLLCKNGTELECPWSSIKVRVFSMFHCFVLVFFLPGGESA